MIQWDHDPAAAFFSQTMDGEEFSVCHDPLDDVDAHAAAVSGS